MLILTDGERIGPTVVSLDSARARAQDASSRADIALRTDDGGKMPVHLDLVAAIEFVTTAELEALSRDDVHMVVRHNGSIELGRVINISANGTAQASEEIQVNADRPWTNTRLNVRAGDLVAFRASGQINFGQGDNATASPDGNGTLRSPANPVREMPVGGLIGRVGNSAPFPIGSNTRPIRMPADGMLMLGVNDQNLLDNSGFFTVAIEPYSGDRNTRDFGIAGGSRSSAGEIRVDANRAWTNTGLNVRAGELVGFSASGRINFGQGDGAAAGPDGNSTFRSPANPVGEMPVGGLIGRVGNSAPFPIGSNRRAIRMPADGMLMLGVNDQNLQDNSGFFAVLIEPDSGNRNTRDFGVPGGRAAADEIRVDADRPWTNTGLNVRAGDLVAFRASGQINFGEGDNATAPPDGNGTLRSPANPVREMPVGGLIGRVGNGAPFPIGSNTRPIRMPADGTLMLGVNDQNLRDNSGFFIVTIREQR